jgi:hypothetical protein
MTRAVWQISGGAPRSYADVFLKHSIALIPSENAGAWEPDRVLARLQRP